MYLSHDLKNTANQSPGLPLHILQHTTASIPLYFPVISCAQQFTGVHLRTSQKPAPKLFNSCEQLRTFPITSGNRFRRFSENFKIIKTSENYFLTVSEGFREFPKTSEDMRTFSKILKNHKKHLENTFELFLKFSKSFINRLSSSKRV